MAQGAVVLVVTGAVAGEEEEALRMSDVFGGTMAVYERMFREPFDETAGEALLNRYPAASSS